MNVSHDPPRTPDEVLHELEQLLAQARSIVNAETRQPEDTLDSLRARVASAREAIADTCAAARKNIAAGAKSADAAVRENPYTSMAIALAAGVLVGLFLGRERE